MRLKNKANGMNIDLIKITICTVTDIKLIGILTRNGYFKIKAYLSTNVEIV